MINIEPVYENIVIISNEEYTADRFEIMKHFFNTLDITILDYEIRIIKKDDFLDSYVDIYPTKFDENLIGILEGLKDVEGEVDDNLAYNLRILAILGDTKCMMNVKDVNG